MQTSPTFYFLRSTLEGSYHVPKQVVVRVVSTQDGTRTQSCIHQFDRSEPEGTNLTGRRVSIGRRDESSRPRLLWFRRVVRPNVPLLYAKTCSSTTSSRPIHRNETNFHKTKEDSLVSLTPTTNVCSREPVTLPCLQIIGRQIVLLFINPRPLTFPSKEYK